ncbi:MAG: PGPGW domain-containing protein [Steroidobacteraceae bacterium]
MRVILRWSRRIGIAIAGGVVLLFGVIMLPLPGPGMPIVVLGLVILSLEFEIARVLLARARAKVAAMADRVRSKVRKPL